MTSLAAYKAAVVATAPLIYWPLDDEAQGSTATDLSGNGHDGAITLANAEWVPALPYLNARSLWALESLPGTATVEALLTLPTAGTAGPFTVMLWARVFLSADSNDIYWQISNTADESSFCILADNPTIAANWRTVFRYNGSGNALQGVPIGPWQNIIFTRGPGPLTRFWINGVQLVTTSASATNLANGDRLRLSTRTAGRSHVTHVAFWDRELSGTEILDLGATSAVMTDTVSQSLISMLTPAPLNLARPALILPSLPLATITGDLNGDSSLAITSATSASGHVAASLDSSLDITVTTFAAGIVSAPGDSSLSITTTTQASGSVGASGDSSLLLTVTTEASGSVILHEDSSLPLTATTEASGHVAAVASVTLPVTADISATASIAMQGIAEVSTTATLSASGHTAMASQSSIVLAVTIMASGQVIGPVGGDSASVSSETLTVTTTGETTIITDLPPTDFMSDDQDISIVIQA